MNTWMVRDRQFQKAMIKLIFIRVNDFFGGGMDIACYTSYFHDGEVLDIMHTNNNIDMVLKSAEVDANLVKNIPLSVNHRITGKLHVMGVNRILNNGVKFDGKIRFILPENDLLHLKINKNVVFCEIGWRGAGLGEIDFSDLEIHATSIWWENIPDLHDSYSSH